MPTPLGAFGARPAVALSDGLDTRTLPCKILDLPLGVHSSVTKRKTVDERGKSVLKSMSVLCKCNVNVNVNINVNASKRVGPGFANQDP